MNTKEKIDTGICLSSSVPQKFKSLIVDNFVTFNGEKMAGNYEEKDLEIHTEIPSNILKHKEGIQCYLISLGYKDRSLLESLVESELLQDFFKQGPEVNIKFGNPAYVVTFTKKDKN